LPVVHGTAFAVAKKVCQTGFTAVSSLDAGYYGNGASNPTSLIAHVSGMYFSSSALYTLPYYGTKTGPSILVCFTIPGPLSPLSLSLSLSLFLSK
jgi:hypothetical protein